MVGSSAGWRGDSTSFAATKLSSTSLAPPSLARCIDAGSSSSRLQPATMCRVRSSSPEAARNAAKLHSLEKQPRSAL